MSSNFKHTPGPWFADGRRVKYEHGHIASFWSPREMSDERLDGESWLDMCNRTQSEWTKLDREVKANACLSAAAPDLLHALNLMLKYFNEDLASIMDDELQAVFAARTALAKALGERQ